MAKTLCRGIFNPNTSSRSQPDLSCTVEQADVGDEDPGLGGSNGALEVLGQSAASAEPCEGALHRPPYNVANFAFEWSVCIERPRRGRPLGDSRRERDASRFVAGESERSRGLMRHRRPGCDLADGGAHGPAHGSPCAARARVVRSDKNRPPTSDRGLRSPCADNTAPESAAGTPSGSLFQGDEDDGEIGDDQ